MAESQNGKFSSSASKEKKTMLDGEIGKEFLSSWKTMSVAYDDPMDFSFNTFSTGKKKAFNFGKLDLDFDLGGDFGKLSSFNVDMPELDFSSPPSKPAKSKEFSERESTSRICQKNQDSVTFSFDFNELDKFDLDLALIKGNEGAIKNPDQKGLDSDNIQQGLKLKEPVVAEATDNMQGKKLPSDENVMSSSFENTVAAVGDLGALHGNLLEKKIISSAEETDRQSDSTDKTTQRETYGDKMVAQSLSGRDHSGETVPDAEGKLFPPDVESNTEHNLTDDATDIPLFDQANLPLENFEPTPLAVQETHECGSGKTKSGTPVENCTGVEPDEATSASILLKTTTHVGDINKNLHCSTSNSLVTFRRNAGDNVIPPKEKELASALSSRFFTLSKVTERQESNPISGGMEFSSVGRKGDAILHSSCHPHGRDGEQNGTKLAGDSKLAHEKKKNGETDFLGSEKNVISLCNVRERLQSDGLVVHLRSPFKEVNKEENVVLGSTKNDKIIHNASLEVCPTTITKPNKLDPQTHSNPSTGLSSMGWVRNSKIISAEGFGAGRKTPDLSSLKILRSKNAIKDQSQAPIKSDFQSNSGIEMEGRAHDLPRSVHAVAQAERKMPVNTSLKRKVDAEASNPCKRLPPAPSDCSVRRLSNGIIDNLAYDQDNNNTENESNTNSVIDGHPIPGSESPLEVNAKELDITPALEDDGNVEKAEAYSKELEDICIMLKKKHEEAKETLVRAIVNNNSLLMLNHPMFDVKICMVQQFAAKLMSDKQC